MTSFSNLSGRLCALAARIPQGRGPQILVMEAAGEATLALSILVENLFEFEIAVTRAEQDELWELATTAGVEERLLRHIKGLQLIV